MIVYTKYNHANGLIFVSRKALHEDEAEVLKVLDAFRINILKHLRQFVQSDWFLSVFTR